jgi:hypothetical protein
MKKPKGKLKPKQVKERFNYLKGERGTWENHWQELADYILPNRNDVTTTVWQGSKRNLQLLDNTAMQANELLAGAMHGLLTNPTSEFFELTTGELELDNRDDVRKWMQLTTRDMHNVINNSNFQTEVHQYYLDLCCLGTAPMSIVEDDETIVRFQAHHIKEIFAGENNKGKIDEVYREFSWNVRQIVGEFGEDVLKLSRELRDAWEKNADIKFTLINAVYPMDVANKNPNDPRRFMSQYILCAENEVELKEAFFREFPFVVARWTKASGEIYGRSPGMNALPDAKTLNKMTETTIIGAQKTVDPPLQLPDDGFIMPIQTRPGGLNYYRAGSNDRIEPVFNDARIDFGFEAMRERRQRIRESFFVDQLQLNQGPQMTATEVLQRTEERMRLLGPMLGRQQSEFLRPMVDRVFEIMARRKGPYNGRMIRPVPQVLLDRGKNLDVTYKSMVAKSQMINEMQAITRTMQAIAPFASIDQSVFDNFDGDAATRIIARGYGLPQEIIRDTAEIEEIRESRQQAQQQMLQAQQEAAQVEQVTKAAPALAKLQQAEQV